MAAYLLADVKVTDPVLYDQYRQGVRATIEKFGGRFLVRGGKHEMLEGEGEPNRTVVLEFPTMEALKTWYHSADYAPLIELRQRAATARLFAVEGA